MMRYHVLTAAMAFLVGLSVGGLAVGQKHKTSEPEQTQPAKQQDRVAAFAVTPSGADSPDSPPPQQPAGSPAADAGAPGSGAVSIELGPISESGQIRVLNSRWSNLESLVERLAKRVRGLERELVSLKMARSSAQEEGDQAFAEALPVATPDDRRIALVAAGVANTDAEEIVWRQSELELERLELQDRALREDWYRSSRYYEALRDLNGNAVDLRGEIGEQAFDQYLYQTGQSNRVKVTSVIQGSAAEQSGLLPGDIIERYGDARIYDFTDLRGATSEGARGEMVPVLIRRNGLFIESVVSRGPMGVRLQALTAAPRG